MLRKGIVGCTDTGAGADVLIYTFLDLINFCSYAYVM